MEAKVTVELTTKEIEALQICIAGMKRNLNESIERLEDNKTRINIELINKRKDRMSELDSIFDKLYEAERTSA